MRKKGDLFPATLHKLGHYSVCTNERFVPLLNRNFSCRARCSVWSHPAGPSLFWLREKFLDGGRWLKIPLAWGTAERLRGAQYVACGRQGDYHRHRWFASPVHSLSLTSFFAQKGGWDPRGSQRRSFCCFGYQRRRGPHKMARPVTREQRKESSLWWRTERKITGITVLPNALFTFNFPNATLI